MKRTNDVIGRYKSGNQYTGVHRGILQQLKAKRL